jgi:hypothetical protein
MFFSCAKVTYVTATNIKHLWTVLHTLRSIQQIKTAKALDTICNGTHESHARRSVTSSSQPMNSVFLTKEWLRKQNSPSNLWENTDPTTLQLHTVVKSHSISCLVYQYFRVWWKNDLKRSNKQRQKKVRKMEFPVIPTFQCNCLYGNPLCTRPRLPQSHAFFVQMMKISF